jgi:protein TonB
LAAPPQRRPPPPTPPPPPSPRPTPKPAVTPRPTPTATPKPKPGASEQDIEQRKAEAEKREAAKKARDDARKAKAAEGQAPAASGEDLAAYGASVFSEIARHKSSGGGSGSVGVVFTVGAGGRIVSHSIVKSSGDADLDARVHAMMEAVQAPPPPGGRFTGRITIRFNGS